MRLFEPDRRLQWPSRKTFVKKRELITRLGSDLGRRRAEADDITGLEFFAGALEVLNNPEHRIQKQTVNLGGASYISRSARQQITNSLPSKITYFTDGA